MRGAVVGFVIGICILQMQAVLPDWSLAAGLCGLAALLFALALRWPASRRVSLPVGFAMIGFLWAALIAHHRLQEALPSEWEGQDITIIGTVASLPFSFEQGVRFNFAVEEVVSPRLAASALPSRLALSWYTAFDAGDLHAAQPSPGERWQLTVRLKRPHGNANPYGFDYEAWLLEQNIRATGYVRPSSAAPLHNTRLAAFVPSTRHVIDYARSWLRGRIDQALAGQAFGGVIVALVIGDQRGIAQSDWEIFNRTGIGHLISISGLHITMIAGLFASLVSALWRRSFFIGDALPLRVPAQKAAAAAGVLAALIYVLLAGAGIPAQRTLIMIAVVGFALWSGRIASVTHVLCVALCLVVLIDPWAVLWPGFWLSFAAVATILYATVGRVGGAPLRNASLLARGVASCRAGARIQYVVSIGLIPLTMLLFGQVSVIGPVANAVAIPLVGLVVTPLSLLGAILPSPVSGWLLLSAHWLVEQLAGGLAVLSTLPGAVWSAPLPSTIAFAAALVGTLWLLAPPGWPSRWIGLVGWLPLVLAAPEHPAAGRMHVTAFDIGQGMALLVETEKHRLLYDTGPAYSPDADGGNRVILPYLRSRGIGRLDAMIVSHSDNDHSGGAMSILKGIDIGWSASSLPPGSAFAQEAPAHRRCEAGQSWTWDGVLFEMLHPAPLHYESRALKPNARSCVLKITVDNRSILLAGDIEAAEENHLLQNDAERLRADVLLAPHHGSATSSTAQFLAAVRPEIAVFQVGYRNRFRHPREDVFDRYGTYHIRRLRTDESGALTLRFGDSLDVSAYRATHARYWHRH